MNASMQASIDTHTHSPACVELPQARPNNYPIIILNIDISSFVNKVIQYFDTATFSCQVQGSHLVEREI